MQADHFLKFFIVALTIGFLSPSLTLDKKQNINPEESSFSLLSQAEARGGRGGGGGMRGGGMRGGSMGGGNFGGSNLGGGNFGSGGMRSEGRSRSGNHSSNGMNRSGGMSGGMGGPSSSRYHGGNFSQSKSLYEGNPSTIKLTKPGSSISGAASKPNKPSRPEAGAKPGSGNKPNRPNKPGTGSRPGNDNSPDYRGGYYGGYYGGGYYGGAMFAGLAVGTVISTLPYGCDTVYIDETIYKECAGEYYEPLYRDDEVQYKAVASPR